MKANIEKPTIKLTVLKEDVGYTAVGKWKDRSMVTYGDNWAELQEMVVEMLNLTFEDLGFTYIIDEVQFEYDLESFFEALELIHKFLQQQGCHYIRGLQSLNPFLLR